MTIQIKESDYCPDDTYFRTGDVAPEINEDGSLTIFNGQGTSRLSWGRPGVTSTVVYQDEHLSAIHIGFHHKHGGGQFWRYYTNGDSQAKRVTWGRIADEQRELILSGYEEVAPDWAKVPGKLRKNYKVSNPKANAFIGYKVMAVQDDGTLTSLYDPTVIYQLGKTNVEQSRPDHNGGFYVAPTPDVLSDYNDGKVVNERHMVDWIALVKCECWGRRQYYPAPGEWPEDGNLSNSKKIAVTYCKPLEIIEIQES